jgi:hypothetical protein
MAASIMTFLGAMVGYTAVSGAVDHLVPERIRQFQDSKRVTERHASAVLAGSMASAVLYPPEVPHMRWRIVCAGTAVVGIWSASTLYAYLATTHWNEK